MIACEWEGNRRSSVAMAMCQPLVVYPPMGSRLKGDEHPAYTPRGVWHIYLYILHRSQMSVMVV